MNFAKRVTKTTPRICLLVTLGLLPSIPAVWAQDNHTNVSQVPTPMPSEALVPSNTPFPLPSSIFTPLPSSTINPLPSTPLVTPSSIWLSPSSSSFPGINPYVRPQEKKNKRNYVSSQEYLARTEKKFNENAYWPQFPIPKISKKFTSKQRKKIWQALLIAQERMQSEQVLDCIDKRVTSKKYDDETPREAVRRFITNAKLSLVEDPKIFPEKNRRQYLYIEDKPFAFHKRDSYNGWAELGYSRFIEKQDLTINLNSVKILEHDADTWAGFIVHEIMHLHSYHHKDYDTTISHYEQFKGNFVYETGWCLSSKGDEQEYQRRTYSLPPKPLPSAVDPYSNTMEQNLENLGGGKSGVKEIE